MNNFLPDNRPQVATSCESIAASAHDDGGFAAAGLFARTRDWRFKILTSPGGQFFPQRSGLVWVTCRSIQNQVSVSQPILHLVQHFSNYFGGVKAQYHA